MYIEKLKLKNYRNYKELEINFDKGINIFYGNNAVGKTNILESIYFSSTSKSHKNSKENEIINFEEKEAHIKIFIGSLIKGSEKEKTDFIDIQLNKDKKKGIAINGLKIDKISDFLGILKVIIFAPEDLNIIKEGPSVRRKFLDVELCQIDKIYINLLLNYNKILNQRNALLKDIYVEKVNKKDLLEILNIYDEQLISYGIQIIEKRLNNILLLSKKIKNIHFLISGKQEELNIDYENDVLYKLLKQNNIKEENDLIINNISKRYERKEVEKVYKEMIGDARESDLKNLYTSIGPHRDDLRFVIDNKDIKKYGSQGQKKTAAISLKLAELQFIKDRINETPVLLLDDVFSELDEKRQKLLVENLIGVQTIITCTGIKKNIFELLKPNKVFKVQNDEVKEEIIKN